MRLDVESLVEAALADASAPTPASTRPASEFSKIADKLEAMSAAPKAEDKAGKERFHKLAMAVILDACEDPKAHKGLEALTQDILKSAGSGGPLNDTPAPSTPGTSTEEVAPQTIMIEKQQIAKGRTLFRKLQGGPEQSAPANG